MPCESKTLTLSSQARPKKLSVFRSGLGPAASVSLNKCFNAFYWISPKSCRLVDGPFGLMGNGIIQCGLGLADTSGQSIDRLSPSGPL